MAGWDDYLQNADDQNYGDKFVPTSSAASGGIVVVLLTGCDSGELACYDSMSVVSDHAAFPISYTNCDTIPGPNIYFPDSVGVTCPWGLVNGFGDAAAGLSILELTIRFGRTTG